MKSRIPSSLASRGSDDENLADNLRRQQHRNWTRKSNAHPLEIPRPLSGDIEIPVIAAAEATATSQPTRDAEQEVHTCGPSRENVPTVGQERRAGAGQGNTTAREDERERA